MKKVLLIGGGGTLGTYTAKRLLEKGVAVHVVCLEDKTSKNENLRYYKTRADLDVLKEFLADKHYDGIVNYLHYSEVSEYPPVHKLLTEKCDHLIVLSSYRVYADETPVLETSPKLLDVSKDEQFVATEKYAISKAKLEKFLNTEDKDGHWTVVRPVISFSKLRFDLVTYYGQDLIKKMQSGETIPVPIEAKDLVAGLDWAGNSGKLIADLLFNEETFGEAYTVSSAQNITWGEVAELYTELIGAKFEWVSLKEYQKATNYYNNYALLYDRLFDRTIDNTKILKATGLAKDDFTSIKEGLKFEYSMIGKELEL